MLPKRRLLVWKLRLLPLLRLRPLLRLKLPLPRLSVSAWKRRPQLLLRKSVSKKRRLLLPRPSQTVRLTRPVKLRLRLAVWRKRPTVSVVRLRTPRGLPKRRYLPSALLRRKSVSARSKSVS